MKWILIQKRSAIVEHLSSILEMRTFDSRGGANQGLGSVHIYDDHGGCFIGGYMPYEHSSGDFSHVFFMRLPEKLAKNQAMYFIPSTSRGLTRAGEVRINQALEALCFCVLTAKTSLRHGIVGVPGLEAQRQFVKLVDDVVRIADASVLISKFQKSLENTRRRLDLNKKKDSSIVAKKVGL